MTAQSQEPKMTAEATERIVRILDSDYRHGTLGKWNTEPVEIELLEGAKPVSSRYYPVPKINKKTFKFHLYRLG